MLDKLEILKKKLLYRASYRGTKEMDILLTSFVKKNIQDLDLEDLKNLEKFLNFEDEVLYNYYHFNIVKKNIDKNPISKFFRKFKI